MKTNLLIDAGQLGSRHLQGLLKYKESQIVYVIDLSPASLEIAKQRACEVEHKHIVYYKESWEDIPHFFDLVIIATNSNVREIVINQLLKGVQKKF